MKMQVRYSADKDIDTLVELVRNGFDRQAIDRTIYASSGIRKFMELQLSEAASDSRYVTVTFGDRIMAFVEYRYLPESINLNYIVLAEEFRGCGLGSDILCESLRLLAPNREKLELDVFDVNLPAVRWYERQGFRRTGISYWYDLEVEPTGADCSDVRILNHPQFRITYERFGFGMLNLLSGRSAHTVGLLGDNWIRITREDILSDRASLAFLADRYADRKFFALLPQPVRQGEFAGVVCTETMKSYRMEIELEELL